MVESFAAQPWLSLLTFAPLIGALFIVASRMMAKKNDDGVIDGPDLEQVERNARIIALAFTVGAFLISLGVFALYDSSLAGFQLVEETAWLGGGISYKLGVDGISILFVLLTTFIMPICILASWDSIKSRVADYMIAFLVLETLMIGVFVSLDLFLFYVFFEGSLIPMFLIIGVWGSKGTKEFAGFTLPSRVYAALKFFLYTLIGSLFLLVAMAWMYAQAGTTDIVALQQFDFPAGAQKWLWLAFFASFAVKMPMWPFHTWLPDA
ncbi:NADH-ubiquinone oxidoreductase chain M, partial [hydrothermal vent metagenome]